MYLSQSRLGDEHLHEGFGAVHHLGGDMYTLLGADHGVGGPLGLEHQLAERVQLRDNEKDRDVSSTSDQTLPRWSYC